MNLIIRSLIALALFTLTAAASDETFEKAREAYNAERYAEAAQLYESMLDEGISNTEVYYNMANACFKNGELTSAVQLYRQAWYTAPRDPDIRANLHFALNAAGAIEPTQTVPERFFSNLSQMEWIMGAIAAYVVFTLLLMIGLLIRPAKRMLFRMSLLPAVVILVATGGWWNWQQLKINPEWVIVKTGATTLFGPIKGSMAHYKVPPGALVRQRSMDANNWVEIIYDGKTGWLEKEYIAPVSP